MLSGEATELRFERLPHNQLRPTSIETLRAGAVTASIDDDIHLVANWSQSAQPLVTLHVYSPPLVDMRTYCDDSVMPAALSAVDGLPSAFLPTYLHPGAHTRLAAG